MKALDKHPAAYESLESLQQDAIIKQLAILLGLHPEQVAPSINDFEIKIVLLLIPVQSHRAPVCDK